MKISVALCTYNGEKFLTQQLDSILHQTHKVDEIIICDDGSTDQTIDILKNYISQFPEIITLYQNEKNLRSVKNFEKAISLCTGDIIFLCDQDDIWETYKVKTTISYFQKNPHINTICSNGFLIDENNNPITDFTIWEIPRLLREHNIQISYFNMIAFVGNIATGAGMSFRKELVEKIIPIPNANGFHHDEWIALLSSYENKFMMIDEKLFRYRLHCNQQVGGINYSNNEITKKNIIKHFNLFGENKTFAHYKKLLKRLSQSYKKHTLLAIEDNNNQFISTQVLEQCRTLYMENKKRMRKEYPIQSFFLMLTDSLTKKRKLD